MSPLRPLSDAERIEEIFDEAEKDLGAFAPRISGRTACLSSFIWMLAVSGIEQEFGVR